MKCNFFSKEYCYTFLLLVKLFSVFSRRWHTFGPESNLFIGYWAITGIEPLGCAPRNRRRKEINIIITSLSCTRIYFMLFNVQWDIVGTFIHRPAARRSFYLLSSYPVRLNPPFKDYRRIKNPQSAKIMSERRLWKSLSACVWHTLPLFVPSLFSLFFLSSPSRREQREERRPHSFRLLFIYSSPPFFLILFFQNLSVSSGKK